MLTISKPSRKSSEVVANILKLAGSGTLRASTFSYTDRREDVDPPRSAGGSAGSPCSGSTNLRPGRRRRA